MLEIVKSNYFIKTIFSFTNEKMKLKIVKHNKRIQKILDINLINYKLFRNKYVIFDNNGIAREYHMSFNELVFEGEYFNG